jgi:hypothetical protein
VCIIFGFSVPPFFFPELFVAFLVLVLVHSVFVCLSQECIPSSEKPAMSPETPPPSVVNTVSVTTLAGNLMLSIRVANTASPNKVSSFALFNPLIHFPLLLHQVHAAVAVPVMAEETELHSSSFSHYSIISSTSPLLI